EPGPRQPDDPVRDTTAPREEGHRSVGTQAAPWGRGGRLASIRFDPSERRPRGRRPDRPSASGSGAGGRGFTNRAVGEGGAGPDRPTATARGKCGGSRDTESAPARLTSQLS